MTEHDSDAICPHCHGEHAHGMSLHTLAGKKKVPLKESTDPLKRKDPTLTTRLRAQFAAAIGAPFVSLAKKLREELIIKDGFNMLKEPGFFSQGRFNFPTSEQKVEEFMKWLQEQINKGILKAYSGESRYSRYKRWTDLWIESAYKKGIERALQEMKKIPAVTKDAPVSDIMGFTPIHADRAGLLYTRTYSDLEGITDAMSQQISRTLAQGMLDGLGIRQITKNLINRVDKIGKTRARSLAATEIIRAHHVANINEYRQAGLDNVVVYAEWTTAQDDRVCAACAAMHGRVFTLDEIEPMIPVHNFCRCCATPWIPS